MGRPVRLANDANCLALSEAADGAGAGAASLCGVILGTGCGGGLVIDGKLVEGAHGVAAEIGHISLPWPAADEAPGPACWCGLSGCHQICTGQPYSQKVPNPHQERMWPQPAKKSFQASAG